MLPVLFSISNVAVSSFGVFLALAFLFGVFLIWRLSRAWDLPEERILDLTLLSFVGGLLGARIFFVAEHLQAFASLEKLLLINKYPGLSFWGGFLGGWLALYFFSRKFKMDFALVADIGIVGFLGGLILGNLGCFLGSCGVGIPSNLFFAVPMVGVIGKRFPVQALEAIALSLVLARIWAKATHFHPRGLIVSQCLIYIGAVKLLIEPLKEGASGFLFPLTLIVLGIHVFYRIHSGKRTLLTDIKSFFKFILSLVNDAKTRNLAVQQIRKSWYNQKIAVSWKLKNLGKILRRMRVKINP
ncbi:prolipoprotein diacylglyceryl transferase [Candidatus Daviesbacteria bacterium]|nr:prolipoprotein diacylglyceryl transferase [Candidatus Daviesbacteria bacterium]